MKGIRRIQAGFHPFWFWNDHLEDDEIRRQISEMADKGIRGFFVHPRQGLGQSYLSPAFFDKVTVALDEAEKRGLDVHLYDEFPYPSGSAGGLAVMGRPEFHATRLIQNVYDVEGGSVRIELAEGSVLEAKAFPLDDDKPRWDGGIDLRDFIGASLTSNAYIEGRSLSNHNSKRYWAGGPAPVIETELAPGRWRIFVGVQAEIRRFKYWGTKADVFNPEAVRLYLSLTHERYAREFGDKFGGVIPSIFTDETSPEGWSRQIPDAFLEEYGYDLTENLHVLQAPDHPEHNKIRADFEQLKYRLFCESWEEQYSKWCSDNGLAYAGEKESVRFEQMRYMDIPGCDPGHTKAGDKPDVLGGTPRRNARTTASAAYFYDKPGALCECFHSLGWSAALQDIKLISDTLLLCGISYLVPHGFFYSTHGLRKHDAPPSVFFQMPYWPLFGRLAEHVKRVAGIFDGAWIDAEVLLVDNGEGIPNNAHISAKERIHEALMGGHIEYLVCDSALLRGGRISGGRIHIKDISAKAIVIPPMQSPPPDLEDWLMEFEHAGGSVLRCAADFDSSDLINALKRVIKPSLEIQVEESDAERLWITRRASKKDRIWFMVNTGDRAIEVEIASDMPLREVALGDSTGGDFEVSANGIKRRIEPFESLMLEQAKANEPKERLPHVAARIGGNATVRPKNKNLLRLYDWRMSLLDAEGNVKEDAAVSAIPLANQLAQSRLSFAPQINVSMNGETRLAMPRLRVRYECAFDCAFKGDVLLVMEKGGIVGDWTMSVNNSASFAEDAFATTDAHIRGSLAANITGMLREGANRLRVDVSTDKPDGGLLNALYLAGDFGASCRPATLRAFDKNGKFDDYEGNGLPHYAGIIEYDMDFAVDDLPEKGDIILTLDFERPFRDACEAAVNGNAFFPVAWTPFSAKMPSDHLNIGWNSITIRVYTSLIRSFEGEYYDFAARRCAPVGGE